MSENSQFKSHRLNLRQIKVFLAGRVKSIDTDLPLGPAQVYLQEVGSEWSFWLFADFSHDEDDCVEVGMLKDSV